LHTSKLLGFNNFKLHLCFSDIQANSAKLAEASHLSNISSKYHKFANVFSKTKAETLLSHCLYNLKINLEKSAQPLVGPIYSLLTSEQEALKEFIEENLNMVSSDQPHLHTVHWSYLLRKKIVHCAFVLTSMDLTASPRRIAIYSYLSLTYWTHLAKLGSTQR